MSKDLPDSEIQIQPYSWNYRDIPTDQGDNLRICCWGLDQKSNPCLVRIENFLIHCFIEVPYFTTDGNYLNWNQESLSQLIDKICEYLIFRQDEIPGLSSSAVRKYQRRDRYIEGLLAGRNHLPRKVDIFYRKGLYYYQPPHLFLCFLFPSNNDAWICQKILSRRNIVLAGKELRCQVWEHDIEPSQKLFSTLKLAPAQWFRAKAQLLSGNNKISYLEKEYLVSWNDIIPIPEDETQSWTTYPWILSFDIETYSANHRAFPKSCHVADVAYMISCIFQKHGDLSTRKKYLIILGPCEEIPDVTIIRVSTETELCYAFEQLCQTLNPTVILSYNGFDFDYR
jgi:DNA polymerase elongation subunit (family B)